MKDCRNPLIYRCQRVSPDYIPMTNGRKSNSRTFKDDDPDSARIPSYGASGGGNIESKPLRIRSAWTAQSPNPDTTSSTVVLLPPQPERDHRSPSKNPNNENGAPTTIGGGDVLLQWGHKKRSRGARVENRTAADEASARQAARIHRRSAAAASSGLSEKSAAAVSMPPPPCSAATTSYSRGENLRPSVPRWAPSPPMGRTMEDRTSRGGAPRSAADNKRSSPPSPPEKAAAIAGEKMVNGSTAAHPDLSRPSDREAMGAPVSTEKLNMELFEWPRIYISLSRKEKEDDFFVMKGTKLPQRPKKRAKNIDKALQYCFPGMWLSELTRGRYEVREKKCVKKQKRRGLKGLESMDSDSD